MRLKITQIKEITHLQPINQYSFRRKSEKPQIPDLWNSPVRN